MLVDVVDACVPRDYAFVGRYTGMLHRAGWRLLPSLPTAPHIRALHAIAAHACDASLLAWRTRAANALFTATFLTRPPFSRLPIPSRRGL